MRYGQRGAKRQPGGGLRRSGGRPSMVSSLMPRGTIEPRDRAHQADRVRMRGFEEDVVGRALLDDARRIHHVHAVGVARHDPEIVRDDDQRDAEPARQVLHQFEDLRLDGDVERGGRLVGDDELRIAGKPDRDHHALAHAAGEMMRILFEPARAVRDADELEQFERARRRLLVGHLQMDEQRLHHLLADRQDRVERGHRLLEDHRDVAAAHLAHLLVGERRAGRGRRTGCCLASPGRSWRAGA